MKCINCETEQKNGIYIESNFYCNFCLVKIIEAINYYIVILNDLVDLHFNLMTSLLEKLEHSPTLGKKDQAEQLNNAKKFVSELKDMKEAIYEYFN